MRPKVNTSKEDRATDTQATYTKKFVKIARVGLKISLRTDKQTHRQTYSSQYFETTPTGE